MIPLRLLNHYQVFVDFLFCHGHKWLLFIVLVHLVASAHASVHQWLLVNAAVGVAKTHLEL